MASSGSSWGHLPGAKGGNGGKGGKGDHGKERWETRGWGAGERRAEKRKAQAAYARACADRSELQTLNHAFSEQMQRFGVSTEVLEGCHEDLLQRTARQEHVCSELAERDQELGVEVARLDQREALLEAREEKAERELAITEAQVFHEANECFQGRPCLGGGRADSPASCRARCKRGKACARILRALRSRFGKKNRHVHVNSFLPEQGRFHMSFLPEQGIRYLGNF